MLGKRDVSILLKWMKKIRFILKGEKGEKEEEEDEAREAIQEEEPVEL